MNKDQVKGAAKDLGGKIQEEVGKLVGSTEQATRYCRTHAPDWERQRVLRLAEAVAEVIAR